jgi:DNA-binding NarL/FixJ family response regulator
VARPVRVLLVEDNEVYRSSLELLLGLEAALEVVGAVASGASAAAACAERGADVVVMDYRLPGLDGAAATRAVLARCRQAAVVCLTAEATEAEEEAIRAAGAMAVVRKGDPIEALVEAVRRAAGDPAIP